MRTVETRATNNATVNEHAQERRNAENWGKVDSRGARNSEEQQPKAQAAKARLTTQNVLPMRSGTLLDEHSQATRLNALITQLRTNPNVPAAVLEMPGMVVLEEHRDAMFMILGLVRGMIRE